MPSLRTNTIKIFKFNIKSCDSQTCPKSESGPKYGRNFWCLPSEYELYYSDLVVEIHLDFEDTQHEPYFSIAPATHCLYVNLPKRLLPRGAILLSVSFVNRENPVI